MEVQGVLVSCQPTGNKEAGVCSGILFADNWILTIGTILDSVFRDANHKHKLFEEHTKRHLRPQQLLILPTSIRKCLPKFTILMDTNARSDLYEASSLTETVQLSILDENKSNVTASPTSQTGVESSSSSRRARRSAGLAAMWRCPLVSESTNVMLEGWQLSPSEPKAQQQAAFKTLLSTFLLLQVDGDQATTSVSMKEVTAALGQLELRLKRPKRGEEVVIESTIFGREFFFNSWSQGIVSNVFGNSGSLLLTDARSGVGCEGGPIFTLAERNGGRRLVGMVLSPVCWWKGEWVGFTIGVALHPMITQIQTGSSRSGLTTMRALECSKCEVSKTLVDSSVVLVRCGSAWGSGVVVDSRLGLILTCSHVVRTSHVDANVGVWWGGASLPATLVYRTKSDVAYDLALLRVTPPPQMQQVTMSYDAAVKGESVFVVGFPMFSERESRSVSPIVTRGIVAHVATPMVQTTCCVQSGASGGPVLRATGELVGIVSCNANDVDTGALFPHVNMAIPATAFAAHVQLYIDTLDVEALRPLEAPDEAVQQMWKLNFPSSKL